MARRIALMRILVTGGSGLVGRRVVEVLSKSGHFVRLAVRADSPRLTQESIVVGDLGELPEWHLALDGIDTVVHLAARVHVMRDHAGGAESFGRINTEGTLHLARAAARAGARRFVYVSTIKVNGEATVARPFRADDEPHASDAYARSKLAAEVGLREIPHLEAVVIRPPLVYGPGAKGNLARFCRLAQAGLPVPFGGIRNRRDLVGVGNLANLVERCCWHPAASGQIFLVSDGAPLSTADLYKLIAGAIGRPARMFNVPCGALRTIAALFGLSGEIDRLTQSLEVDITKTVDLLGWSPTVSVAEGICEMARAYASETA